MKTITIEMLPALFESVARVFTDKCDELCEMDARLGDGDLGLTMKKGFSALPDILRASDEADLGKRIMKAGMKMGNIVPSTMGTLMASGLMGGGKAVVGKTELDCVAFSVFLRGFCEGVDKRSKTHRGECCLLDALWPAAEYAEECAGRGGSLAETAEAALKGAQFGVEATKDMLPSFGKAAVHADMAAGIPDQGACAGRYMLLGFREYIASLI